MCAPSIAYAQEGGPSRPYRGLFGDAAAGRLMHHTLDVTTSVAGGYDDNVLADFGGVNPGEQKSGSYFTLFPAAAYRWQGSRVQLDASGSTALRRYGSLDARTISHAGALGLAAQVGGKSTVSVHQRAEYSPAYLFGLFPGNAVSAAGEAARAGSDSAASSFNSLSYGTTVAATHGITPRTALSASGDISRTEFPEEAVQQDMSSHGVGGQLSHRVARNTTVTLGYRFRSGNVGFQTSGTTTEHLAAFGVDHDRPLSATRRAVFGFKVGPSIVSGLPGADGLASAERRYNFVAGEVSAGYQFGRSWQARGSYHRGLEYVGGLSEPVWRDAVSVQIDGSLTRRVEFVAASRYSGGGSVTDSASSTFTSYMTDVRLRRAFSRGLAAYAEYTCPTTTTFADPRCSLRACRQPSLETASVPA